MTLSIGAAQLPNLVGWQVLQKTKASEQARLAKDPQISRDIDYFKANIGKVKTPDDLVKNPRLLSVVLDAYGLGADVNAQARIRKVLEGGTLDPNSMANKLIDPRYKEMAGDFSFDILGNLRLQDPKFIQSIVDRYSTATFEEAIGDDNPALRNATYFQRKIGSITSWYSVLSDKSLFEVVKTGYGLPDSFSSMDVDKQAAYLESKIGLDKLKDPAGSEKFIKRYLAMDSVNNQVATPSPALQILNAMTAPPMSYGLSTDTLLALLQTQGLRS